MCASPCFYLFDSPILRLLSDFVSYRTPVEIVLLLLTMAEDSLVRGSKSQVADRVYVLAGEAGRTLMSKKGLIPPTQQHLAESSRQQAAAASRAATAVPASAAARAAPAAPATAAAAVASASESKQHQVSMMDNPLLAAKGDSRKSVRLSDTTRSSAASSPSLGPASEAPTVEEGSVEVDAAAAEQTAPATSAADGGDGDGKNIEIAAADDSSDITSQRDSSASQQGAGELTINE